jgi:crotonobetainyl-CoA:carnitine CoA-transferase CaiB-like acyl-CoA transferase
MGDAAAERRGDAVATQAGASGAESGGALSGLLVETAADPRFLTNEKRVEHREALQALLSQRLRCGTADDWFHLLMTRGAPTVGCRREPRGRIPAPPTAQKAVIAQLDDHRQHAIDQIADDMSREGAPPTW